MPPEFPAALQGNGRPARSADCPFPSPLVVAGATATGKTAVAQWIAERTGAAIVSADSMLVYRGMDVGTAKPTREERARVRYIGLDCVGTDEPFSVGDWLEAVRRGLSELPPETPIIVAGGTGLYIKALLQGLDSSPSDPEVRARYQELFRQGGLDALRREIDARGIAVPPGDAANPRRLARALERAEIAGGMPCPQPLPCPQYSPRPRSGHPPLGGGMEFGTGPLREGAGAEGDWGSTAGGVVQNEPASVAQPAGLPQAAERPATSPHGSVAGIFPPDTRVFCLDMPRDALAERIRLRVRAMFAGGLVEEAVRLFGLNPSGGEVGPTASGAIGYAEALAYARGELTRDEAEERIAARTRQLAKRQLTWFRHQLQVEWVAVGPRDDAAMLAAKLAGPF